MNAVIQLFDQSFAIALSLVASPYVGILSATILIATPLFTLRMRCPRLHLADVSVVLFCVWQSIPLHYTHTRFNVVTYGVQCTTACTFYFLIRYFSAGARSWRSALLFLLVLLGFGVGSCDLFLYVTTYSAWKNLGFSDLLAFRGYFPMIGSSTKNDDLAFVLCLLPFSVALYATSAKRWPRYFAALTSLLLLVVLAAGLSRGIWLACATFIFAQSMRSGFPFPRDGFAATGWSSSLVRVLMFGVVIWVTVSPSGLRDASQQRSADGRLHVWHQSLSEAKQAPLFGLGGFNGPIASLASVRSEAAPFTSRTYNAALQILLQNGVLGLFIFSVIPIAVIAAVVRCANKYGLRHSVWASGLIALLVADANYTSIPLYAPCMIAFFSLAALSVPTLEERETHPNCQSAYASIRLWMGVLGCFAFAFAMLGMRERHCLSHYDASSRSINEGSYAESARLMAFAPDTQSCDPLYLFSAALSSERLAGISFTPNMLGRVTRATSPSADVVAARNSYSATVKCLPSYGPAWHNLAWIHFLSGDTDEAFTSIQTAIHLDPNEPLFHITRGMFLEARRYDTQAEEEYARALSLRPSLGHSQFFRDVSQRSSLNTPRVIALARAMVQSESDSPLRSAKLGALLMLDGHLDAASSLIREALTSLPTLSGAWDNLGAIEESRAHHQAALLNFRRALFLDPTSLLAEEHFAIASKRTGSSEQASRALEKAERLTFYSNNAVRVSRLFRRHPYTPDDLTPRGLLSYTTPLIDPSLLCKEFPDSPDTRPTNGDPPRFAFAIPGGSGCQ